MPALEQIQQFFLAPLRPLCRVFRAIAGREPVDAPLCQGNNAEAPAAPPQFANQLWRYTRGDTSPGSVPGVARLTLGREQLTNLRMDAISSDQQAAAYPLAPRETGCPPR